MAKGDPLTYAIIGAAMAVHRILGRGFLESVYHDALALEFGLCNVPFQREFQIPVYYRETRLASTYRADFVCYDKVIVELKALPEIGGVEKAQILNYLKGTGYEIGLLINFGETSLKYERIKNFMN